MRSNRIAVWLLGAAVLGGIVLWSALRTSKWPRADRAGSTESADAAPAALEPEEIDLEASSATARVALEGGAQDVDERDGRTRLDVLVVHLEDGLPVEGAFVRVVDRDRGPEEGSKGAPPDKLTNAAGLSSWRFAPGTRCRVEVGIVADGDPLMTRDVVLEAGEPAPTQVECQLAPWIQYEFHARFFERASGLPIPGLVIELCGGRRRWTCDAEGRFVAVGDGRGQILVREPTRWSILRGRGVGRFSVLSADYLAEQIEFDREHPDVSRERVVLVARSAAMKGRILRPDGSVGRDTSVRVQSSDEAPTQGLPIVAVSVTTDARGRFEFERLPSGQPLRVVARGLFGVRWNAELDVLLEPGETRAFDVRLDPAKPATPPPVSEPTLDPFTVQATVTVFGPDGSRSANAKLSLGGRRDHAKVSAVGGGRFEIRAKESGWFTLEASEGGGLSTARRAFRNSFEITPGAQLEIHLVALVEIQGKVVDALGESAGDVRLNLRGMGNVMSWQQNPRVEHNGSFRFEAFPGEHELHVSSRYFEAVPFRVTAPAVGVVLTLPKLAALRGRVVDEAGRPVQRATVCRVEGDKPESDWDMTRADGTFELKRVSPGNVVLRARLQNEMQSQALSWVLVGGQLTVLPDIVLERLAHVHVVWEGTSGARRVEVSRAGTLVPGDGDHQRAIYHVLPGEVVLKAFVDDQLVETRTVTATVEAPVLVKLTTPR